MEDKMMEKILKLESKRTETLHQKSERCHMGALSFHPTSVEAEEALVAKHLLCTVEAVLIHQLSHKGSSRSLVLHTSLD